MGTDHSPTRRRAARDRHGRGLRRPLLPAEMPGYRTRGELFDEAVLDAVAHLDERWPEHLHGVEFAVDEVPAVGVDPAAAIENAVVDEGVVLSRFFPPGVDGRGRATKARIVVYRRPIELRATGPADLAELVTELLAEQLTDVFGESD